jgi:catechol 1,2-dioxygenase
VRSALPTEADVGTSWSALDDVYRMEAGEAVLPRPPIK